MHALSEVPTISFNRSYLGWAQWGFAPTYYCVLDPMVIEDNADELRRVLAEHPDTRAYLNETAAQFGFAASGQITLFRVADTAALDEGRLVLEDLGNVGASSLQILIALGFRRVVLTGVDGYVAGQLPSELQQNYFSAGYAEIGRRIPSPSIEVSRLQWDRAARACRQAEVDVANASPGSRVDNFKQMALATALQWLRESSNREKVISS